LIKKIEFFNIWGFLFLLAFSISSYGLFSEPEGEQFINLPDKIAHFIMFLILSFLLIKSNKYVEFSLFFIIFYAILSEIIQYYLPYREFDLIDLFFNFLGIGAIFIKIFLLNLLKNKK
jgi:VanZ family protein